MAKNQESKIIEIAAPADVATVDALALSRVEIDTQIATAKQYPRDLARVTSNAMYLVQAHMEQQSSVAEGLYYALKRGGKDIEGPNVRLAEIIQHSYGNSRAGARPIEEGEKFVIAEGVFHDLENNTAIRMHVKRRITDKDGHRYNDDMIGVTENAACAIAYRNAVLKGIPKAIWWPLYQKCRKISGGRTKTETVDKRAEAIAWLVGKGIPERNICERLGVSKVSEITAEKLATLKGICTAIAAKETTTAKEFNLKAERTTSDVKSSGSNGTISHNQVLDIMTLMQDWKLKDMDVRKALDAIGHKAELQKLPAEKVKVLIAELEKRKR
jgi:hypothetical protein